MRWGLAGRWGRLSFRVGCSDVAVHGKTPIEGHRSEDPWDVHNIDELAVDIKGAKTRMNEGRTKEPKRLHSAPSVRNSVRCKFRNLARAP